MLEVGRLLMHCVRSVLQAENAFDDQQRRQRPGAVQRRERRSCERQAADSLGCFHGPVGGVGGPGAGPVAVVKQFLHDVVRWMVGKMTADPVGASDRHANLAVMM